MFSRLMPRQGRFFDLFNEHAARNRSRRHRLQFAAVIEGRLAQRCF
jgi:hypothetical protein